MLFFALNRYPKLDLHGEYTLTAYTVIHDFLKDQVKLKNKYAIIIHGKGSGKLKKEVHHILSKDALVKAYNLDPNNTGQTIVELKI